jgi:pimeloyl-ACP methyl ester carboxylesterase
MFGNNYYQPPGRSIDIGGHCLYINESGKRHSGLPTVILEAGHSNWSHAWLRVQSEIEKLTHVVAYDRAGFGWSEPGPLPRTPVCIVAELHSLLERVEENGPYIFVGHSLGAAFGRLFCGLYPGEIVGMVWVDSAHEHMQRYMPFWDLAYLGLMTFGSLGAFLARLGVVQRVGRKPIIDNFPLAETQEAKNELVAQMGVPRFYKAMREETRGWYPPENWSKSPLSLGDIPVIMIEVQYPPKPMAWYPPRQYQEFRKGWVEIQDDLSRLSTRTKRVPVECSHDVMYDRPDMIIQAVKDLSDILGYQ